MNMDPETYAAMINLGMTGGHIEIRKDDYTGILDNKHRRQKSFSHFVLNHKAGETYSRITQRSKVLLQSRSPDQCLVSDGINHILGARVKYYLLKARFL